MRCHRVCAYIHIYGVYTWIYICIHECTFKVCPPVELLINLNCQGSGTLAQLRVSHIRSSRLHLLRIVDDDQRLLEGGRALSWARVRPNYLHGGYTFILLQRGQRVGIADPTSVICYICADCISSRLSIQNAVLLLDRLRHQRDDPVFDFLIKILPLHHALWRDGGILISKTKTGAVL